MTTAQWNPGVPSPSTLCETFLKLHARRLNLATILRDPGTTEETHLNSSPDRRLSDQWTLSSALRVRASQLLWRQPLF
jgi:hypothetical protein